MKVKEIDSLSFCLNFIYLLLILIFSLWWLLARGYILYAILAFAVFVCLCIYELSKEVEITDSGNGSVKIIQRSLFGIREDSFDICSIMEYYYGGNGQGLGIQLVNNYMIWISTSRDSSSKITKELNDLKSKKLHLRP